MSWDNPEPFPFLGRVLTRPPAGGIVYAVSPRMGHRLRAGMYPRRHLREEEVQ